MWLHSFLLTAIEDEAAARSLFKMAVEIVEIETSSFCNRRCFYCPNANIDRISTKKFLDRDLFEKILRDLSTIDYSRDLVLARFNEPMADEGFADKVALAHEIVPNAKISCYSNGDYLDRPLLDRLYEAGLRGLTVSIHLGNTKPYDHDQVTARLHALVGKLGLQITDGRQTRGLGVRAEVDYKDMEFIIQQYDYDKVGNNRAGLVEVNKDAAGPPVRRMPCFMPSATFNIDHMGNILPCCVIIPEAPEHEGRTAGHLRDFPSIFAAYAKGPLLEWRRHLLNDKPKAAPCDRCDIAWSVTPESEAAVARVLEDAVARGIAAYA